MLATLIPLFDENMAVSSYSIFVQKDNFLLNPSFMGSGRFDGATRVEGLEIVDSIGMETLSGDKDVFVEINNVSIFSNVDEQCGEPHSSIVFLIDDTVAPVKDYVDRLKELKSKGYKLAIQKLPIEKFEPYREILSLMDYILLNHKKIKIEVAKVYFGKVYPNIKLCAVNVETQEEFDRLKADGGYTLYEGSFFRKPRKTDDTEVAPLKVNYIELLNVVNDSDFDLSDAAKVIGRDTALVISLLEMVNRMTVNKGISSVAHAASMLGQKELKRWINTAVTKELCADRPSEITRLSMLRAKFAENLAQVFEMPMQANELFLMGLFSVLDVILDKPIDEALKMVKVSKDIEDALIKGSGNFAPVMDFVVQYENAFWQEVSRIMVLSEIDMDAVYNAYIASLRWYRDLFSN